MTTGPEAVRSAVAALTLAAESIPADDDAAAFLFVVDLNDALAGLSSLLSLARALVERAALGPTSREHVLGRLEELTGLKRELDAEHEFLRELRPLLEELKTAAAERDRIAEELTELRRLQSLAGELAGIRAQQAALESRRAELETVAMEEREAGRTAQGVLVLAESQLDLVEDRTRETLQEADRADRRLAEARAELAEEKIRLAGLDRELDAAVTGFEALKDDCERRLPSLESYRQADQELAEGLGRSMLSKASGLDLAEVAFQDVEQRLRDLDTMLRPALRAHDEAYDQARAVLGLL